MACSNQQLFSNANQLQPPEPVVIAMVQDLAMAFDSLPGIQVEVTEKPQQALLSGAVSFAASSKKWSDETMSSFGVTEAARPTVTVLTAPLRGEALRQVWSTGAQPVSEPYYLYALTPLSAKNLEQARYLYSDAFQQSLMARQLFTLPEPLRARARVVLGLQAPTTEGGYQ
jgi:hypothetical protein